MTSIVISTQDHLTDTPQSKTLEVNPAADNAKLKTWAQMGVALSKDVFVKVTRVDKTDL